MYALAKVKIQQCCVKYTFRVYLSILYVYIYVPYPDSTLL